MTSTQKGTFLTPQQRLFIDFVAAGQITAEGEKLTFEAFAQLVGVDRRTLYKWQSSIPDFWNEVAERTDFFLKRYLPKINNAMVAKALKGDVAAAKLVYSQANHLKQASPAGDTFITIDDLL